MPLQFPILFIQRRQLPPRQLMLRIGIRLHTRSSMEMALKVVTSNHHKSPWISFELDISPKETMTVLSYHRWIALQVWRNRRQAVSGAYATCFGEDKLTMLHLHLRSRRAPHLCQHHQSACTHNLKLSRTPRTSRREIHCYKPSLSRRRGRREPRHVGRHYIPGKRCDRKSPIKATCHRHRYQRRRRGQTSRTSRLRR